MEINDIFVIEVVLEVNMRIPVGFKIFAFIVMLAVSVISAGGLEYIMSNIPVSEEPITDTNPQFTQSPNHTDEPSATDEIDDNEVISDDWYYKDKDIEISIEMVMRDNITYYVADVKISDAKYLKSAFAKNRFGRNSKATTSAMAKANNAIFAVNGDYYGSRDYGIIVRNGVFYRNRPEQEMLAIFNNGDMKVYHENEVDIQQLLEEGLNHTYSFGPGLVIDGEAVEDFSEYSIRGKHPRTGVGIIEPLHYIFITVDARQRGYSIGMTLAEFAKEFEDRGCKYAYNLDGGGSATMYFNGRVINRPCDFGGERSVSDILYIGR